MKYDELREEISRIVEICQSVPERFQDRCFELLLGGYLAGTKETISPKPESPDTADRRKSEFASDSLPTAVQVFLAKSKISDAQLRQVVFVVKGEAHFLKDPPAGAIAASLRNWAFLIALKSAIEARDFIVDPETLRSLCQEKQIYDAPNFAKHLKNLSKFFKDPLEPQGEARPLNDEGQKQLAALILQLAGQE